MTRFFFDIRGDGGLQIRDFEGMELPDLKAAHEAAIETAKALLAEVVAEDLSDWQRGTVEIWDEGKRVASLPIASLLANGSASRQ
jgi:hypothetical protein